LLVALFVNLRVRDSRLGRAWVALREDEVAAVSMGIPLVRTKLLAYAMGAAFGGMAGAFLGTYYTEVNAGQFQLGFSIFILAMATIGGLGSIWGAVTGGLLLGYINDWLIPDVLNNLPSAFGPGQARCHHQARRGPDVPDIPSDNSCYCRSSTSKAA
jgi:branched-chain amino acid transport system permease protein